MCLVSTNNEEKNMVSKESMQRGLYKNLCKKTLFWDWEKLLAAVEAKIEVETKLQLKPTHLGSPLYLSKCVGVTEQVVRCSYT